MAENQLAIMNLGLGALVCGHRHQYVPRERSLGVPFIQMDDSIGLAVNLLNAPELGFPDLPYLVNSSSGFELQLGRELITVIAEGSN